MENRRFLIGAGIGCLALLLLVVIVVPIALFNFIPISRTTEGQSQAQEAVQVTVDPGRLSTQESIATFTPPAEVSQLTPVPEANLPAGDTTLNGSIRNLFVSLYDQQNPGVVNIQVFLNQGGVQGGSAGSGFIIDDAGHIVTNNHVVQGAEEVTVIFFDGFEAPAQVIGTDDDSDLAIVQVNDLPDNVHSLELGDSNLVNVGEWVIAIGNPFGLGSSMSVGVVSAIGRTIESGATPYSIPHAIQTDAAINPGNSGGPLINAVGEVIGVNAQIATGGVAANAGVGFAIPSNVVRQVVPVLIETGVYRWPRLGVSGVSVNLLLQQANNLDTQRGAYIDEVVSGGPADEAGLRGSTGTTDIQGITVPVGGDVVVEADGEPINTFDDLLLKISQQNPGDQMNLTVLRNGERMQFEVVLEARPQNFQ